MLAKLHSAPALSSCGNIQVCDLVKVDVLALDIENSDGQSGEFKGCNVAKLTFFFQDQDVITISENRIQWFAEGYFKVDRVYLRHSTSERKQ